MPIATDTTLFWENQKTKKSVVIKAIDCQRYSVMTRQQKPIRCVDVDTGAVVSTHSIASTKAISKDRMLKIETDCGYILNCTPNTMIYAMDGYIRADELEIGTQIKVNGQPSDMYKDREWLKEWYVKRHKTQREIAEMCSTEEHPVSERTIRAWVKKFGLGRGDSGGLYGEKNPRWKGDVVSRKVLYERARFAIEKAERCEMCGYVGPNIDIHHKNHDLTDFSPENLIALCEKCHFATHKGAVIKHVRFTKIVKIEGGGYDPCIDICTEAGNYVAAGFIIKGFEQG